MSDTLIEIEPGVMDPLHRKANEALMVAWINRDLRERMGHDVRKSVVLYDADRCFMYALAELPDEYMLRNLREMTNVRYWSKGI